MKRICVFCGSSYGNGKIYTEATKKLGEVFVTNNLTLVYGGANVGLMGVLADQMLRLKGEVIGIIPGFMIEKGIAHTGLSGQIVVGSMHERKERMQTESDAFIAMPGGYGTIEEIFEMITWGQLNIHKKPCAFLNTNGYYDFMHEFLNHAVNEGFIEREFKDMVIFEEEPEVLIQRFFNYTHPIIDKAKIAITKRNLKTGS
ncbi:MAG: TIGR00730 family Rossman fold protein [Bacteroidetes bacterium]|nr:TIGR00730 family Rossman fold protein [Bacteroidota bacterium]